MPLPRLVPDPTHLSPLPGRFTFDAATALKVTPGAEGAARLLRTLLGPATGLPLPARPDGSVVLALDPALTGLGEEGYGLTVGTGGVLLRAADPRGLLAGIQTLRQLLPVEALADEPVAGVAWTLPCVQITDTPRFPWRGSMLDVARRFRPVSYLRRYVDLLALHKLNVLHLHLTDDQGWRMPVAALPRLTEIGGEPHGGAYTRAELTGLVTYAAERGITVVPETEMPGHVRAALAAHPELGNTPGRAYDVWDRWGVCDTVLGVHDTAMDFCRTVLDEVMDVFPSPYVHIGGEECPTTEWHTSPDALRRVAEEGLSGPDALHGWFMGRIGEHLLRAGRRPLSWTENGADLPEYFTVMPWRDSDHGRTAVRRGHRVVMAPHRTTYLDYPQSTSPAEPPGQAGEVVDLRTVHGNDPAPADWSPEEAARVLGSQVQLWTEYVPTAAHAEYLTFPRLCALAEVVWTGRHDWPGFQERLRHHRTRLDALGVPRRLSTTATPVPHL
ncbi:beta-hexosaminidase [Streptomyces cinereoruber]|uniref:beta-N-acetylhexosaminidase n=1 Tax=Streptomyces cinereoruber TaxID=67260 RepID=A0AAV4KJ75_9ACTN|nr:MULTISPECIES: beta-N-acetylhexosaminidase [Streptomyces]AVH98823.1 beta-hexosaminidase [Streptomyces sp. WAC00288]KYG52277.1 beta-hexosaminidase [Streptomyces sp. WAC04657]MBB4160506.1 hexosaminidase [Streptomyces cinereoruber]MBY8820207.1 beta-N-acetylhexosaminidase [Streptomyces cinereoruber]NIH62975.1 hexosaminidase [Streptomyces cinereoruber]